MLFYVICATQRTGSHLLCDLLSQTKIAGRPREHYFKKEVHSEQEYFDQIWNESVVDNVGGFQIMADKIPTLLKFISYKNIYINKYIWLQRKDKIRQAISWLKAKKLKLYFNDGLSEAEFKHMEEKISISLEEIQNQILKIALYEVAWHRYFVKHKITPYIIYYEDIELETSWNKEIEKILDFLDIDYTQPISISTKRKRQSTTFNEKLYHYFIQHQESTSNEKNGTINGDAFAYLHCNSARK